MYLQKIKKKIIPLKKWTFKVPKKIKKKHNYPLKMNF